MWKKVVTVVALSWLVYWSLDLANRMGIYRRTYDHAPGPCRLVPGIEYGSEDIQTLPNGLAFISSGYRGNTKDVFTKRPGRIYLFDFNKPEDAAVELKITADPGFKLVSPHGLSLWTDSATGTVFVYVISHFPGEIVDKFRFEESTQTLTHLKRITGDPSFHALDDIAIIGEDQFYFTNFWYLNMDLEVLLGLHWGSIGFYDGTAGTLLVTELLVPNGIALSSDNKYLYVAHTGGEEILVYKRNEDNSLAFSHAIKVNSALDNVDVDAATGDLWIGSHPVTYKIMVHIDDPEKYPFSPSHVLRIKLDAHSQPIKIEEIYSNDGTELSGSTVAVKHKGGLLIGSLATKLLYCEMK